MTKLECNVTSCLHNADNHCCRRAIVIDGQEAREKEQTCCGSFDENRDSSFRNVFKTPENSVEISCEAVNCIYNENHRCEAKGIGVIGDGANRAEDTLCATFAVK